MLVSLKIVDKIGSPLPFETGSSDRLRSTTAGLRRRLVRCGSAWKYNDVASVQFRTLYMTALRFQMVGDLGRLRLFLIAGTGHQAERASAPAKEREVHNICPPWRPARRTALTWLLFLFALRPPYARSTQVSFLNWPHSLNDSIHEGRCQSEQHDAV